MQTPITSNDLAILGTGAIGFEKTWRPSRSWNLGLEINNISNQIQQVKTSALITPASSSVANQGQAQPVQNLRITRRPFGNQIQVSVSFTPNANDRYFQGVAVSLTQGDGTPLQVAFGKVSPVTFVTGKSNLSSSISVQSVGSLGDTPIAGSPGRALSLT